MCADFACNLSGTLKIGRFTFEATSKVQDSFHNMILETTVPEIALTPLVTDLLKVLNIEMSICPEVDLNDVSVSLGPFTNYFALDAKLNQSSTFFFVTAVADDQKRGYIFGLCDLEIDLSKLPVIGEKVQQEFKIAQGMIIYSSANFTNPILPCEPDRFVRNPIFTRGLGVTANLIFQDYKLPLDMLPEASKANEKLILNEVNEKKDDKIKWFSVNKTFGPLQLQRIGLEFSGKKIGFLLEAGIKISGLAITLDGLEVNTSLAKLTDLHFTLKGLGISFKGGPVEISGAFLKTESEQYDLYNGSALIKVNTFSLMAIGSYATPKHHSNNGLDQTSLFLFGMATVPMGGPPYFYLKGIALGFGYNRNLTIPKINEIRQFPLLAGVLGEGDITSESNPDQVLQEMNKYLSPAPGQYWLAAGVKFSSFETINIFGVLCVSFGAVFEVTLIGIGTLQVPAKVSKPAFMAELAIVVSFSPANGVLGIAGSLTSASYILSKDCRITGGFAFYIWFAGQHKGDFVVTLGGYHRDFPKPAHYPTINRLGLNWVISDKLSIKGGGYFALSPSCLMAGGELEAVYQAGNLKAWFTADAHFLMNWKPFHYDINVGVSIGVSYKIKVWRIHKTVSTQLSASLHLWGPDFSGKAKIHWSVISFTIEFGNSNQNSLTYLGWSEFASSFLPKAEGANGQNADKIDICTIRVDQGLLKEVKDANQTLHWIIKADELAIITHSAVPITSVELNNYNLPLGGKTVELGILPMGENTKLRSIHKVSLQRQSSTGEWVDVSTDILECKVLTENVPEALWGQKKITKPSARVINDVPVGMSISAKSMENYHQLPQVNMNQVDFNLIQHHYSWGDIQSPMSGSSSEDSIEQVEKTIMNEKQVATRSQILHTLKAKGYLADEEVMLEELASSAQNIFNGQPELINLTYQNGGK